MALEKPAGGFVLSVDFCCCVCLFVCFFIYLFCSSFFILFVLKNIDAYIVWKWTATLRIILLLIFFTSLRNNCRLLYFYVSTYLFTVNHITISFHVLSAQLSYWTGQSTEKNHSSIKKRALKQGHNYSNKGYFIDC